MASLIRRRGDGSPPERALEAYATGRVIESIEAGALTEEGYSVLLVRFVDGESMTITAVATSPGDRFTYGVVTDFAIHFFRPRVESSRLIVTPGEAL